MENAPMSGNNPENAEKDQFTSKQENENMDDEEEKETREQAKKQERLMSDFEKVIYPAINKLEDKSADNIEQILVSKSGELTELYNELDLEENDKANLKKLAKALAKYDTYDVFATAVKDKSDPDLNNLMKLAGAEIGNSSAE